MGSWKLVLPGAAGEDFSSSDRPGVVSYHGETRSQKHYMPHPFERGPKRWTQRWWMHIFSFDRDGWFFICPRSPPPFPFWNVDVECSSPGGIISLYIGPFFVRNMWQHNIPRTHFTSHLFHFYRVALTMHDDDDHWNKYPCIVRKMCGCSVYILSLAVTQYKNVDTLWGGSLPLFCILPAL